MQKEQPTPMPDYLALIILGVAFAALFGLIGLAELVRR
jgi:hypothetical protein